MEHEHEYETISHPDVTPALRQMGITAAELRRCTVCQKVMPFVQTKDGLVPLFDEKHLDEQDILLA